MLKPAEERLAVDLDQCPIANLKWPLVTNVDAQPITVADDARSALKRQVSRPVRWQETVEFLLANGVRRFVEIGPGKVLLGMIRAKDKSVALFNAEDEKSLENVFSGLL